MADLLPLFSIDPEAYSVDKIIDFVTFLQGSKIDLYFIEDAINTAKEKKVDINFSDIKKIIALNPNFNFPAFKYFLQDYENVAGFNINDAIRVLQLNHGFDF